VAQTYVEQKHVDLFLEELRKILGEMTETKTETKKHG